MEHTRCSAGQSIFQAAKEKWGENTHVEAGWSANHNPPNPKTVEKFGQPIGTVTVRQGESLYVYRTK